MKFKYQNHRYAFILIFIISQFIFTTSLFGAKEKDRKPMNVLVIGNSFSRNATRYLPDLALEGGHELLLKKAEISGGPLKMHWDAVIRWKENPEDKKAKPYTGGKSLYKLLTEQKWDIITLQQGSTTSAYLDSYYPYIRNLYNFIRNYQPDAEIVIHQTWSYRYDAPYFSEIGKQQKAANTNEMYELSRQTYQKISKDLASRIIPTGDAFWMITNDPKWRFCKDQSFDFEHPVYPCLPKKDYSLHVGYYWTEGKKFELDTHHASEAGCYLGSLVWYSFLFNESPEKLQFVPKEIKDKDFVEALKKAAWKSYNNRQ